MPKTPWESARLVGSTGVNQHREEEPDGGDADGEPHDDDALFG